MNLKSPLIKQIIVETLLHIKNLGIIYMGNFFGDHFLIASCKAFKDSFYFTVVSELGATKNVVIKNPK